jgi:hypothetical protein
MARGLPTLFAAVFCAFVAVALLILLTRELV